MANDIVRGTNLGPEFDQGAMTPGQIRVKIDETTIVRAPDGTLSAPIDAQVQTAPLYEYRDLWAEESGTVSSNQAEWSMGNGATGEIGVPFSAGWEVIEMYFHADAISANADISIAVGRFNPGFTAIATLDVVNAGQGVGNHGWDVQDIAPAVVPLGVIGFQTLTVGGGFVSDARVGARFRRQIGTYVTGLTIN